MKVYVVFGEWSTEYDSSIWFERVALSPEKAQEIVEALRVTEEDINTAYYFYEHEAAE